MCIYTYLITVLRISHSLCERFANIRIVAKGGPRHNAGKVIGKQVLLLLVLLVVFEWLVLLLGSRWLIGCSIEGSNEKMMLALCSNVWSYNSSLASILVDSTVSSADSSSVLSPLLTMVGMVCKAVIYLLTVLVAAASRSFMTIGSRPSSSRRTRTLLYTHRKLR